MAIGTEYGSCPSIRPFTGQRVVQVTQHYARLRGCRAVLRADAQDAIHAAHVHGNAAVQGRYGAGDARSASEWHQRETLPVGQLDELCNLRRGAGSRHGKHARGLRVGRAVAPAAERVRGVVVECRAVQKHVLGPHDAADGRNNRLVVGRGALRWNAHGGECLTL